MKTGLRLLNVPADEVPLTAEEQVPESREDNHG